MRIRLNKAEYADKVKACWIGKNIGGTMGSPYEGVRRTLDIKGFATEAGVVLPNDDLDLQLVWLYALEKQGPMNINALTLGEYWLTYITPHWNEYGIGKVNLKRGLLPPLSGNIDNEWRHSNGAWIRTEIWACLAPAAPHIAADYAISDAKVDHGSGEGTFAAAFVGAMQSAAFVEKDLKECISIGLSAIPKDCRMAKSVRLALECYDSGKTWLEARNAVFESNADLGNGWFEAPSNVTYSVIGLLYGEGDFKKSMITAINCGDDTDCTAATVGATLGILGGMAAIPEDWQRHIGDEIVTISIARGDTIRRFVPNTCTELAERVVSITPFVLKCNGAPVDITDGDTCIPQDCKDGFYKSIATAVYPRVSSMKEYTMEFYSMLLNAEISLSTPRIKPGEEITMDIKLLNRRVNNEPYPVKMRWLLPEGFSVDAPKNAFVQAFNAHYKGDCEFTATLRAGERVEAENRIILEVLVCGHPTPLYCSFLILS